jgi:hypothetical protein
MPLKRSKARRPLVSGFNIRFGPAELRSLDAWIKTQPAPRPSRREAILRLIKQALAGAQPPRKRSKKAASQARDMARRELDRLGDESVSANERERRKRRLTRGPSEFRDIRADLPKPKN